MNMYLMIHSCLQKVRSVKLWIIKLTIPQQQVKSLCKLLLQTVKFLLPHQLKTMMWDLSLSKTAALTTQMDKAVLLPQKKTPLKVYTLSMILFCLFKSVSNFPCHIHNTKLIKNKTMILLGRPGQTHTPN